MKHLWRMGGVVAGAMLLAILAGACDGTPVSDLEVGDCIRDAIPMGEVETVRLVDCSEQHYARVLAMFDVEDSEFPGLEEFASIAQERCPQGTTNTLFPTEQSWNEKGDREVICLGE